MTERDYGYVATTFAGEDIESFQDLAKRIAQREDLYYSNTVDYIQGDVSSKLHLTLFYGLLDEKIDRDEMNTYLASIDVPQALTLGGLTVKDEYKGYCQILWVDVLDKDGKLREISESFRRFPYEESVQLGFVPHLTLAYVRNGYQLPGEIPDYPKEIKTERIKYFEK